MLIFVITSATLFLSKRISSSKIRIKIYSNFLCICLIQITKEQIPVKQGLKFNRCNYKIPIKQGLKFKNIS